jgi:uncharacterized protein (DUF58 family)
LTEEVFDSAFLRKLELLSILSKKIFAGKIRGERKSSRRGSSVEFADFREYVHGDDFRYIDWNAYARLENLFLKLFVEEEEFYVYILLDGSKSMDYGKENKLAYARRVAAAFAYIALANLDRVSLFAFGPGITQTMPAVRGKSQIFNIFRFLEAVKPEGETSLNRAAAEFVARTKRLGVVVILSDFLSRDGYEEGLKLLNYSRFEPLLVQILSEEEVKPDLTGDLRLVDMEDEGFVDISLTRQALSLYRRRLAAFLSGLDGFCKTHSLAYFQTTSSVPFEDLILRYLRQAMMLK